MRRLVIATSIILTVACDGGKSTQPRATVIKIHVNDDRGVPVDRMPVRVMVSTASRVSAQTGSNGSVDIRLSDAGTYSVSVVPREGYLEGVDPLSKVVTVAANENATVTFTVYRAGISTADPTWRDPGR